MVSRENLDTGIEIADEAVEDLKRRIGIPLRVDPPPNTAATIDNIKKWAWGIGDDNPLWLDEEYAKKSRWGGIIAPPTFVSTCGEPNAVGGLPGIHALWTEDRWEFFQPARLNDQITSSGSLLEVSEKRSTMSGRMIQQVTEMVWRNQRGEIVCKKHHYLRRFPRHSTAERGVNKGVVIKPYTKDEITAIEADYDKEDRRGSNPRYWEEVNVGDDLGLVVKGPLTVTDIMAFQMGGKPIAFTRAHRIRLEYDRRHPRAATLNELGIPDVLERVHWEDAFAKAIGAAAPFDYGWQRVAWSAQLFTNWMGDDGFLKKLHVQLRRMNYVGDTTWFEGKVTGKRIEDGEHLVECEFWGDNRRRNEKNTNGWATVILPSRG